MNSKMIETLITDLKKDSRFNESEVSAVAAGFEDYLDSFEELKSVLDNYNNSISSDDKEDLVFDLSFQLEFHLLPHLNDLVRILKKIGH